MNSLRMNITRDCNLNCDYCYITNKTENIDLSLFKNLLAKYKPNTISLSGGEPFMHAELGSFIRVSLEQGAKVNVVTNGSLLSEKFNLLAELKELIGKSNTLTLSISIDGIFKCNTSCIQRLHDLGIKLQLYFYPSLESIETLSNLNATSNYFEAFHLLFPIPMGRNKSTKTSKEEWTSLVHKFKEICAPMGIPLYVQQGYSTLFKGEEKIPFAHNQGVFIDSNGKSYACCFLAETSALGYKLPSDLCEINKGDGCLALTAFHGKDYRLQEDVSPPCPLDMVRIL